MSILLSADSEGRHPTTVLLDSIYFDVTETILEYF